MQNTRNGCSLQETVLQRGVRAVTMENDFLFVSILPDKGADIYQLVYKPKDVDVLWKSPRGIRPLGRGVPTASDTQAAWMENYEGGWQEIFPNGGDACTYKGGQLNFHGEISTLPWDYRVLADTPDEVAVEFSVYTFRSPFKVERTLTLRKNESFLEISEKITNLAEEEMDYMWGHHPALGAPFLDEGAIIQLPEGCWIESQAADAPAARMRHNTRSDWPVVAGKGEEQADLSKLPPKTQRSADLAFIGGFAEGWYGITNPALGMGFGMVWPQEVFPHMWFWQELRGSFGYPWYGANYVMAIEPFTSYDASGLTRCIEKGTARRLQPGETVQATLLAVCYESVKGIKRIDKNGNVHIIN